MSRVESWGWTAQAPSIPQSSLDIEVLNEEPEIEPEPEVQPEIEPEVQPEPEIEPEPEPRPRPRQQPAPEEPQEQPPEVPPQPEPVNLTGITLTNPEGSFAIDPGNGDNREGPISSSMRATSPLGMGTGGAGGEDGGSGPRFVAAGNLSERPTPPRGGQDLLRTCIERRYPGRARRLGLEARVNVSLRIDADGSISRVRIRSESVEGEGFGRACAQCMETLPRWSPPRDRQGRPVATDVRAHCSFGFAQ